VLLGKREGTKGSVAHAGVGVDREGHGYSISVLLAVLQFQPIHYEGERRTGVMLGYVFVVLMLDVVVVTYDLRFRYRRFLNGCLD
jgi:hypothetical protein